MTLRWFQKEYDREQFAGWASQTLGVEIKPSVTGHDESCRLLESLATQRKFKGVLYDEQTKVLGIFDATDELAHEKIPKPAENHLVRRDDNAIYLNYPLFNPGRLPSLDFLLRVDGSGMVDTGLALMMDDTAVCVHGVNHGHTLTPQEYGKAFYEAHNADGNRDEMIDRLANRFLVSELLKGDPTDLERLIELGGTKELSSVGIHVSTRDLLGTFLGGFEVARVERKAVEMSTQFFNTAKV